MEFCPWPSLDKCLGDVPDAKIHALLRQLVQAVKFLDDKGLVHRDIKPANIVVSEDFNTLKLLDFGVIRRIAHDEGSGTDGHRFIATAQYSPPEFLLREEKAGTFGFAAINIYQIGAVLHDLITKTNLFHEAKATRNRFILFKAVTEGRPRIVSASVPPRLIALCIAALDKDPVARVSSVNFDDFMADADDLDALRKRIARGGVGSMQPASPTLAVWRPRVRAWGMEAAQLEAETLGALRMKAQPIPRGQRWQLDFTAAATPIFFDLISIEGGFAAHVLSDPTAGRGAAVFVISADGPDIPETGIPGALAAQYLYALDLALCAHRAASTN